MINVGRDLADAVKERTPKREFYPEKFLSGCKVNSLVTVAEEIPR